MHKSLLIAAALVGLSAAAGSHALAAEALPGRADPASVVPQGPANPASGAPADWMDPMKDDTVRALTAIDRAEFGTGHPDDSYLWEAFGWVGGDIHRFWWKTEGEGATAGGAPESASLEASYGQAITPFWNALAGLRYDTYPRDNRVFGMAKLVGLAPGFVETELSAFVSQDGVVSARGEFEYEALLTQRLRLAPRAEINLGAQDRAYGLGSGLQNTEMGLRLKYQVIREFTPYIGVRYEQSYFDTADQARRDGESDSATAFVVGFSAWY
ncbi:copper resistance protein B [uncultured Salinisphaera sp.]|uniref:copper resistance protein B n=1 Tax=uncultured Salinisphaera sp. TaxID=359372 RepID=UPI0032B2BDA7|tara:strand:+ start:708 stop:1517 length:810 start_codon:yes stop_codon:yes gene_type:complete